MDKLLLELLKIGSKKNYEFHLKIVEDEHNIVSVDAENKIINVEIGLPESKDLPIVINNAIKEVV
jgi:hypothetical protein